MEFGPRALGARSIIGDPRSTKMQQVMNLKIKFRESFRPFAPSVLREQTHGVLRHAGARRQPLHAARRAGAGGQARAGQHGADEGAGGHREAQRAALDVVPSITHVDFSARVQTVTPEANGRYYRLIKQFHERTGCPVLVNTSFNIRGEPIVCTPQDAYRCFMGTHMDALVLENTLLLKEEQPDAKSFDAEAYKQSFSLD